MELGAEKEPRQQVTFDLGKIPEGWMRHDDTAYDIYAAFAFGHVSFDNPLHTATAASGGIDGEGRLDMGMVAAIEHAAEYLSDKQGKPVLLVDIARDPEAMDDENPFVYMNGYIGIVADIDEPVGMVPREKDDKLQPGIAVAEGFTNIHGYIQSGAYRSQYLSDMSGTALPLSAQRFRIGHPGYETPRDELEYTQEIVAGEDIVPWINEIFGDGDNGYKFYMDVIFSLLRHDHGPQALESISVGPFESTARQEFLTLWDVLHCLQAYERKVANYRKLIDGATAEANIALESLGQMFSTGREPRTHDSYPITITTALDGVEGSKLPDRYQAIEFHIKYLDKFVERRNNREQ